MIDDQLTFRILTSAAELSSISADWAQLYRQCPGSTPFQHPEWLLAWITAFHPRDLNVVELRAKGALVGIAPLLIYPRDGQRVLAFAGGGVSDYLDALIQPAFEECFFPAMLEAIDRVEGWDIFELTDLPSNSVFLRTNLARYTAPHDNCSSLCLPSTKEDLLHLFSKRQRANLRNARSRLERAGGATIESATAETLPEFMDDLFRLHTDRWSHLGQSGVLADKTIRRFHQQAAPGLLARGILHLLRLRVADQTAAALYTLRRQQTTFCYMQGFDPEFRHLSPGTQLLFSAIEDALEHGMKKFDFLRGEEPYKQHWRARRENTFRVQLQRSDLAQFEHHSGAGLILQEKSA